MNKKRLSFIIIGMLFISIIGGYIMAFLTTTKNKVLDLLIYLLIMVILLFLGKEIK